MQIVAKTNGGVLIDATEKEVKEILNAVTGEKPVELKIGQKIPAIDYSSTITKLKLLSEEYSYRQVVRYIGDFIEHFENLKKVIESTKNISL